MARNLNFWASIGLNTKEFRKGLSNAKHSMEEFRRSFLTMAAGLGAGIGLGHLVSNLRDVATSLSVARATLRNVSNGFGEYSSNLKFINELTETYHQDMVVLTDSFAKFHAAAMGTNFTLEEQKDLFKGLTQAATFFHMSGERTANMLIAVEQMMSKGKVTAEELRRQLGNNLPGAYARVAQAAVDMEGVINGTNYSAINSFADFEKAMDKGEIGVDVLKQFIKDLNETTQEYDTSSLQLAMNDLKTAWEKFVDSTNVEHALKGVYSTVSDVIRYITQNFQQVAFVLDTIFISLFARKIAPAVSTAGRIIVGVFKNMRTAIKAAAAEIKAFALANWATAAIAAVSILLDYIIRVNKKIHEVNNRFKEIQKIDSKSQRLYELSDMYVTGKEFVEDNQDKFGAYKSYNDYVKANRKTVTRYNPSIAGGGSYQVAVMSEEEKEEDRKARKYFEYLDVLPKIEKEIDEIEGGMHPNKKDYLNGQSNIDKPNVETPDGNKKNKPKTVSDYLKAYQEDVQKISNQYNAGSKTLEEANDDLDKLSISAWENITAFDDFRNKLRALPPELRAVGDELEGAFYSAKDRKATADAEKKAKEQADAWKDYNEIGSERKPRDTRFDYRLSEVEKLRAQQEEWDGTVEDLQKKSKFLEDNFDKLGAEAAGKLKEVNDELLNAQKNATNLKDAADLAEWREEIKGLEKSLTKEWIGGIAGAGRNIKSLVDGAERIKKVFKDTDASDWDKIESILGEIAATFQLINNLVETYNTLTKISEALSAAKGATELTALSQQTVAQGSLNAEKATDIALTNAGTVAQGANMAATLGATGAKSGEAVANATASGAKLPFPYNLAAIAAGVAAVVAALSMIKGFAGGGIISGSRHGDNNLAAVNGGEMILNSGQQARLWNMLNGKRGVLGTGSPEITFRLRGPDIIGAIKNTEGRARG